jgi:hypothetical protein
VNQGPAAIALAPAWIRAALPAMAWRGMNELHKRATGSSGSGFTTSATELSPQQAFAVLSNSIAATLAQIAVTDVTAANRILGSICEFADANQTLDGLESIFLSALGSALRAGPTQEVERATRLWQTYQPRQLGGGARTTTVLAGQGDLAALVTADQMAKSLGSLPADPADQAAALTRLFDQSEPGIANPWLGIPDTGPWPPSPELQGVGRALAAFAGTVAGTAEVRRWLLSNGVHGGAGSPHVLDRIAADLARTTGGMMPSTGSSGPIPFIAQGRGIVVDVVVLGSVSITGGVGAVGSPTGGGPPPAIHPDPTVLTPGPDGMYDLESSRFWRGGTSTVPTFLPGGPSLDHFIPMRSETTLFLLSMPKLASGGDIAAQGYLQAVLPQQPPRPHGLPEIVSVAVQSPSSSQQRARLVTARSGTLRAEDSPVYVSLIVYPHDWSLTGGDPAGGPRPLVMGPDGMWHFAPPLPGPVLEADAVNYLEVTAQARNLAPDMDIYAAVDEITR